MKNLFKAVLFFGIVGVAVFSCKKEEVKPVEEITEVENTRIVKIDPVPYGPDLVVTFVNSNMPILSPSACGGTVQQPSCGIAYTLTVKVTNIGNAPTTSSYELGMEKPTGIYASYNATSPSSSLAPGATDVFIIGPAPFGGCTPPFGRQKLIFTADIYDEVAETNEANNTARAYQYCGD